MRGKYSPTVTAAYMADSLWWINYTYADKHNRERVYVQYDSEGFDSYGYDVNDKDRAGNWECSYYENNNPDYDGEDYNWAYEAALDEWGFDGVKPVRK